MLTMREAKQRLAERAVRLVRRDGEYRVTHFGWEGNQVENGAYYTDDVEDALFTGIKIAADYAKGVRPTHDTPQ